MPPAAVGIVLDEFDVARDARIREVEVRSFGDLRGRETRDGRGDNGRRAERHIRQIADLICLRDLARERVDLALDARGIELRFLLLQRRQECEHVADDCGERADAGEK